jgi:hypothetical protein
MSHPEQRRTSAAPATSARIVTLDDLREHLQWAIELEHATLPPYLCALYSLDPERNPAAVEVVASVFAEEMFHLALAANLLNAVGGPPTAGHPGNAAAASPAAASRRPLPPRRNHRRPVRRCVLDRVGHHSGVAVMLTRGGETEPLRPDSWRCCRRL